MRELPCSAQVLKKYHCLRSTSIQSGLIDLERVTGIGILKSALGLSIKINNGSIGF